MILDAEEVESGTWLSVYEPPEWPERVVAPNPDPAMIDETVRAQPWREITFVVFWRDDRNHLEVSGSREDGFCVKLLEDGVESIRETAPESLEEMIALLQGYGAGDARWRHGVWS